MSIVDSQPVQSKRRRRRRLLIVGALLISAVIGGYVILQFQLSAGDRREWVDACAEADALDPGWRYEDLFAKHYAMPIDTDSVPHLLAAAALVPQSAESGIRDRKLNHEFLKTRPDIRYSPPVVAALRELLGEETEAVKAAAPIAGCPNGRVPISTAPSYASSPPPKSKEILKVVKAILFPQLALRAEDGDISGGIESLRAIVYASRPLLDSPLLLDNLFGVACRAFASQGVERILGQGVPSQQALTELRRIMEVESEKSVLLQGFRGERATVEEVVRAFDDGRLSRDEIDMHFFIGSPTITSWPPADRWLNRLLRPSFRREGMTGRLRNDTWMIECMKKSPDGLKLHGAELVARLDASPQGALNFAVKFDAEALTDEAPFRCALVALAAEQFRLDHKRWPKDLTELVPDYLAVIPPDPFDLKPLRLAKRPDGIVIYSVGANNKDDGGAIAQDNAPKATDLGIRLWDVEHRRKPPVNAKKP